MVKAEVRDGNLLLEVPLLAERKPSGSGKTELVASTGGGVLAGIEVDGRPLFVNLTAYVRPEGA